MVKTLFFDASLEALVNGVVATLGEDALLDGVALRDATGLLSFISSKEVTSDQNIEKMADILKQHLESYARAEQVLLFRNDPGAKRILEDEDRLHPRVGARFCNLLDRRILGSGWLTAPLSTQFSPPRIVFASLKGGVGRSTALAIAASDLAMRAANVLVIDLDLEAPGLGDLMLPESEMPKFGVVDFLVENGIGGVPDAALQDFVGTSSLTLGGGGRVDVAPAFGSKSKETPQNVIAKLSRALIEDVLDDGRVVSVGEQISEMLQRFTGRSAYDVVLIDSRAGLSELAAPAVLGLGATVLLFGTAQKQTISGYQPLFSSLKSLAERDAILGRPSDWRLMFKPVYAKANLNNIHAGQIYIDDLYDLFAENLYDDNSDGDPASSINFSADDPDAPHAPLVIPFDPRFVDFDSALYRDHLAAPFYEQSFRPFLKGIDQIIEYSRQNHIEQAE